MLLCWSRSSTTFCSFYVCSLLLIIFLKNTLNQLNTAILPSILSVSHYCSRKKCVMFSFVFVCGFNKFFSHFWECDVCFIFILAAEFGLCLSCGLNVYIWICLIVVCYGVSTVESFCFLYFIFFIFIEIFDWSVDEILNVHRFHLLFGERPKKKIVTKPFIRLRFIILWPITVA